jgi:hypothetical protein
VRSLTRQRPEGIHNWLGQPKLLRLFLGSLKARALVPSKVHCMPHRHGGPTATLATIVTLASHRVSRFLRQRRQVTIQGGLPCCGKRITRDKRRNRHKLLRRTSSRSNMLMATSDSIDMYTPPTDTMGVEGCLGSLSAGLHPLCPGRPEY